MIKKEVSHLLSYFVLAIGLSAGLSNCQSSQKIQNKNSGQKSESNGYFKTIVSGLDTPWEALILDDNTWLISERPGKIIWARNGLKKTWLDLNGLTQNAVNERGEGGLMGMALDPKFTHNKFVYVVHTYNDGQQKLRLLRLKADTKKNKGLLDKVLIDNIPASTNHNGGRLKFGPDEKLYWTVGELFNGDLAQSLNNPNGKILRINSDGTIPSDNPFKNSRIYSYGHRNPQGLAWDTKGQMYSSEHGPSGEKGCCQDELNLIQAGKNYGWPKVSGDEKMTPFISPLIHSGKNTTWAPGGLAFVKTGKWKNHFLLPGLRGEAIYKLKLETNPAPSIKRVEILFQKKLGRLRQVIVSPKGEIFVLTSNRDGRFRREIPPKDDRLIKVLQK